MIKILALLVFILSIPSISIAEIPEATGKPIVDISIAYGAIVGLKFVVDICGENFPEYKNNNQHSYNEWRSRNEKFIKKLKTILMR